MIANKAKHIGSSARELAASIASGEVSALEVVEVHIARIEAVNPKLNAVVVKRYDEARAEARQADEKRRRGEAFGQLQGVPITIKDSIDLEGLPSTFGVPSRTNTRATADDLYAARLRAAGAIVLGKTNAAQLLMSYETDNPIYGRTNNPWNLERTAGGSSGGESAIIAAGGSSLGLGSDIAGSVRIPAAFSGIVGFKPTNGRTNDAGRFSVPPGQRAVVSQIGVLSRTVDDVALGLEVINGGREPNSYPPMPLGDPNALNIKSLRVAYYTHDGTFNATPAARRAVLEAAAALEAQGAAISEFAAPDVPQALGVFFGLMTADGARGLKEVIGRDNLIPQMATLLQQMQSPRALVRVLDGIFKALGQQSSATIFPYVGFRDTHHYWQMIQMQMDYQERFKRALETAPGGPFDVILCPANALPAITHGSGSGPIATLGAYALLYNFLGYPAGVLPWTRVRQDEETERPANTRDWVEQAARKIELGSAGMPIGVQVVARPWRDHVALGVMRVLETSALTRADRPRLGDLGDLG
jgi:fatty acid amide hydrolase